MNQIAGLLPERPPRVGELVEVRSRRWLVEAVETPAPPASPRVALACADDDAQGRTLEVWWDFEIDRRILEQESWGMRTKYVAEHPEAIERLFQERDAEFDRKGVCFLIVFDGLDRCAGDWKEASRAIRGLLQTAVEMRSCRKLRVEVFLRSDQADEDHGIADSPDTWKALATKIDLSWPAMSCTACCGATWRTARAATFSEDSSGTAIGRR